MLYVKMKGPGSLEIRTENSVKVAANLAITPAEFYASKETFITNVAAALGIQPSRIRIANVVAGRRLLAGRELLQEPSVKVRLRYSHSLGLLWSKPPARSPPRSCTRAWRTTSETVVDTLPGMVPSCVRIANVVVGRRLLAGRELLHAPSVQVRLFCTFPA